MKFYTKQLNGLQIKGLYKLLCIIRFMLIFTILSILQVNASTYGQKINLNQELISIHQVFKEIKIQTGYDVLWKPNEINVDKKIKAQFNAVPIVQVIRECIMNSNIIFEIQDQTIILKANSKLITPSTSKDSLIFYGRITDENDRPMVGATVKIRENNRSTFTTVNGKFAISGPRKGTLEISYIGYLNKQVTLNRLESGKSIEIKMSPGNNNLGEVNIVSTGYQDLPKERATGSFEVVTKEQLQHSSDPNLVKRLEGITTSMNFNNQLTSVNSAKTSVASTDPSKSPLANLTIRGRNTLNASQVSFFNQSGEVLVVIDGVPSPYPIDNINPNDVETITVLKDAAAASIWGSRAANGVIVIKTKRGGYEKPVTVSFNSNFNVAEKPDLFYKKTMSTSDYIDAQAFIFQASKTNVSIPTLSSPQPFLSPVAEILGQQQNGQITSDQASAKLNALRGNDVRRDFDKYILRNAFTQSYSLGIDGGSKNVAYRISGGYDKTLENSVGAGSDRLSLAYNTSFKPFKNFQVNAGVTYTVRKTENQAQAQSVTASIGGPYYPYTRLVDDQGNAVSIPYKYRSAFINLLSTTYGNKIQDLTFTPLNDIKEGYYRTTYKNLNFNIGINYKINGYLSADLIYNYGLGNNLLENLNRKNSFYTRDLVTYYTSPDGVQSIPNGSIYSPTTNNSTFQSLRTQLNLNKNLGDKSVLNVIAGMEATQAHFVFKSIQYFGYDEKTLATNNQVDYVNYINTLYSTGFPAKVPYTSFLITDGLTRTYSLYSNGAYTYNRKYTISGSLRRDMSSDFGVGTNKGGAPFFSFGGKWNLSAEDFYKWDFLPTFQLRATYGFNGNVNPSVSARPIITYSGGVQTNGLLSATTGIDATNQQLRPEKTGVLNLGIDFGVKNGRISGSLEYYDKRTTHLIASNAVDPATGFNRLTYNTADMNGRGVDFSLSSQNFQIGKFNWTSNFLFSYNRVKVVKLFTPAAKTAADGAFGSPSYNVGADLSRIYAFQWAGLDPVTGSPRGYVNGMPVVVNDASSYLAVTGQPLSTAHYFGSAVPVYFGSLRNTLRYASFSFSANILFKFKYYFRRTQSDLVQYSLLSTGTIQGAEYSNRWQKTGDELLTNVPSFIYPANNFRDLFYQFADINVQKADHIRLQELNFSYFLTRKNWFLKNPRIYVNISNLGIIWRANKLGLDPDVNDYPNPKTYAFGFSANF